MFTLNDITLLWFQIRKRDPIVSLERKKWYRFTQRFTFAAWELWLGSFSLYVCFRIQWSQKRTWFSAKQALEKRNTLIAFALTTEDSRCNIIILYLQAFFPAIFLSLSRTYGRLFSHNRVAKGATGNKHKARAWNMPGEHARRANVCRTTTGVFKRLNEVAESNT